MITKKEVILVKKILVSVLILGCFLLFGCSEKDEFARNYTNLMPNENNKYSIYTVGHEVKAEELMNEGLNSSDYTLIHDNSLESSYPKLELKEKPAYVIFDRDGLVFKTYEFEALIEHLKELEN